MKIKAKNTKPQDKILVEGQHYYTITQINPIIATDQNNQKIQIDPETDVLILENIANPNSCDTGWDKKPH